MVRKDVMRLGTTYTLAFTIVSTSLSSPSATWTTSSIKPAPILCSSSEILRLVSHFVQYSPYIPCHLLIGRQLRLRFPLDLP